MKKQSLAFFLALALCLGLAVPAFAADAKPTIPTLSAPENSGIVNLVETIDLNFVGFARSGSNNAHITYDTFEPYGKGPVRFVPKGMDIVVKGVKSADEVTLHAFSDTDMEESSFKEGPLSILPGGTYLFYRLFVWETGKDVSLAPLDFDDPMKFEYDDPKDGKTHVAGNITAADAGFQVNEDGDIVLDSERLYELLGVGNLVKINIGEHFTMYRLCGEPYLISNVFADVDPGKWFTDPVVWAFSNSITTGTSDDKFSPGQNCTEAQILTFLYRAAREEQVESSAKDMELAVQWAREKGMIDDSFDGNKPCTRAAAVNYIWQAFDKPSAEASSFTDVDANADYAGAVSWAVEKGVTNGTNTDGTAFSPDQICTRGHIVTFLYRAYNN